MSEVMNVLGDECRTIMIFIALLKYHCTPSVTFPNLTQGNESKLKEHITEGKKSGQKQRGDKGQGQGQSHKLLFCPYYFVQFYILFIV